MITVTPQEIGELNHEAQKMATEPLIPASDDDLLAAIKRYEIACKAAGGYMPALATRLRIIADELADRYPDDANGGRSNG